ncbi:hypothetical protein N431DRAFT_427168 [Stipitochalara longipes BDJ]|nr:hypothetical protein N431DRAFT_427168 [Stipitochalara longipes BDJ]
MTQPPPMTTAKPRIRTSHPNPSTKPPKPLPQNPAIPDALHPISPPSPQTGRQQPVSCSPNRQIQNPDALSRSKTNIIIS